MITKSEALNVDLWEAWIDLQFTGSRSIATLFVIGDVMVNNTILEPRFEKVVPGPGLEGRLVLKIVPNVLCDGGLETEILYAEELDQIDRYSGVTICFNDEVIVEMDNLECIY